jgi:hypothetical protein
MKTLALRTMLALGMLFGLSSLALAQNNNCAYTFSWTQYSFSFCVSQYGTLGMLQAPIGVNHLDPVNPVEGWVWFYWTSNDSFTHCQITGVSGCNLATGSFTQPNGPGTLPLIYNNGGETSTFTANPVAKSISITTKLQTSYPPEVGAYLERDVVFQPGGNASATVSFTGFGPYALSSYGDRLTTSKGCFGNDAKAPTPAGHGGCAKSTFTGSGGLYAVQQFGGDGSRGATLRVTYTVF